MQNATKHHELYTIFHNVFASEKLEGGWLKDGSARDGERQDFKLTYLPHVCVYNYLHILIHTLHITTLPTCTNICRNHSTCGQVSDFSTSLMYRNLNFLPWQIFLVMSVTNIRYAQRQNLYRAKKLVVGGSRKPETGENKPCAGFVLERFLCNSC